MSKIKVDSRDSELLAMAIALASEAIAKGGGPFGAIIARNGEIISGAWNEVVYTSDPTAHAEIMAIRKSCEISETHSLKGCTLYASCEPCPMCLGAIYWAGISRVVYAADRKDAALAGFGDDDFYKEMNLEPGKRKIEFVRIPDAGGEEPFRVWKETEGKVPY